jgi:bifunctional non-homologous end joining protein LigD
MTHHLSKTHTHAGFSRHYNCVIIEASYLDSYPANEELMSLVTYRKKRNFKATSEPKGQKSASRKFIYVVQKHQASHLHYDFRLALKGVLKSWAVPKGPSLQPSERRLAVEVEDHPLEYAKFEGIIPKGEYGGGAVMLWDKGTWEPLGDPIEGYHDGKIEFMLHGEKLKGQWVLVKMKTQGRRPNWLLIKHKDKYANHLSDEKLLNTKSVKSGRNLEEIAAGKKHK